MKYPFYVSLLAVVVLQYGCLQRHNNYGIVGQPVCSADNQSVTILVAENEAITYSENGGFRKTNYSTTYWLKQYETSSGKLLQKKKLSKPSENNRLSITCYGRFNNQIWLYINGIRAFDINSFEEITNEEKMAAANSLKKTIFPIGDRLVYPSIENGYIYFTADNGEQYVLALANQSITTVEKRNKVQKEGIGLLPDKYGTMCDTFTNKVFILAKDSAAAAGITPSNSHVTESSIKIKLFSANYSLHKPGTHYSYSYKNIKRLSNYTFLNPFFAKDTYNHTAIQLRSPAGFLLLHQDVLGEKSKAIISRIDTAGNILWQTATGVSTRIENCVISGKYCIITTNKDYMPGPNTGKDALCIVNTNTGQITLPLLYQ